MMEYIANSDNNKVFIFNDIGRIADTLLNLLKSEFRQALSENRTYHLALSGGSTPLKIFKYISEFPDFKESLDFLHIYWSDERCVPPHDSESNYGNIWNTALRFFNIPGENIHRIKGEDKPEEECIRYGNLIRQMLPLSEGLPRFNMILLGLGEDGHTASIFPGTFPSLAVKDICYTAVHPVTARKRITFSMELINNSGIVIFLVTGDSKSGIVKSIVMRDKGSESLPAYYVNPAGGSLYWYLDSGAANKIR